MLLEYWVSATIISLAFEHIPSWELFSFSVKLSSLLIILGIPLAAYTMRGRILPIQTWEKAIGALLFFGALSFVVADDFTRALSVWLLLCFVVVAYLLISRSITNDKMLKRVFTIYLITAVVSAFFAFWQFMADSSGVSLQYTLLREMYSSSVFGFPRVQAFLLEPLFFAFYLLPALIWLIGNNIVASRRLTAYWTQLVLLVALGLTLSRGAFIALVFGLIILVVLYRYRTKVKMVLWPAITTGMVSVALVLALIYFSAGEQGTERYVQHTISQGEFVEESTYGRLAHYREAWRLFTTSPIIGIGLGNYGVVNSLEPVGSREGYQMVNNQYLETLAETGLLGLGALLAIVGLLARELWIRSVRDHKAVIFLAILGAMLMQWHFFSNIYILQFWAVLGIIAGYLIIIKTNQRS